MKFSAKTNQKLIAMYTGVKLNNDDFHITVFKDLINDGLITPSDNYHDKTIYLTDKGIAYVEEYLSTHPQTTYDKLKKWVKDNFLQIITVITSLATLIITILFHYI